MKRTRSTVVVSAIGAVALATLFAACSKPAEVPTTATRGSVPVENVGDRDVTTNVKTALLRDSTLKNVQIDVVTVNGDVRLIGALGSQAQIDTALTVARGANGVRSIHDELTLKK